MSVSTGHLPLIGITAVPRDVTTGYGPDRADTASRGMVAGVVRAGGVPVVLPVVERALAARQLDGVHGLVLSGGQDLDAALRGEARHPASRWLDADRDRHEVALLRAAMEHGTPILGICRGLQLAVDVLGGRLVAHLDGHDSGTRDLASGHSVSVRAGSHLAAAVDAATIRVNSLHHQAIEQLPAALRSVARAEEDGTLEAAEGQAGRSWFLGVQWHPELMLDEPGGQCLFDALAARAADRAEADG